MDEDGSIVVKTKIDGEDGKVKTFFYLEEPERAKKRFQEFNEVIDYFDTYPQPPIDKNK